MTRIGELGKARAGDECGFGQHRLEDGFHGGCAQKHGLFVTAAVQYAVREDMAALEIGTELHLVDGEEGNADVRRHGFDRCHPIARACGNYFFFAGDEGHRMVTRFCAHPVIDLACQQAQRQADHAAAMGQHALHSHMGFTGIGGAQHGCDIVDFWHLSKLETKGAFGKCKLRHVSGCGEFAAGHQNATDIGRA